METAGGYVAGVRDSLDIHGATARLPTIYDVHVVDCGRKHGKGSLDPATELLPPNDPLDNGTCPMEDT